METEPKPRRGFLRGLIFIVVWAFAVWHLMVPSPKKQAQSARIRVEKEKIPAHGALVYEESHVALLHENGEIYALSLVCTYQGCAVEVTAQQLVCPCHGCVFDRKGGVVRGPANRALRRLTVEDRGEYVEILLSTEPY